MSAGVGAGVHHRPGDAIAALRSREQTRSQGLLCCPAGLLAMVLLSVQGLGQLNLAHAQHANNRAASLAVQSRCRQQPRRPGPWSLLFLPLLLALNPSPVSSVLFLMTAHHATVTRFQGSARALSGWAPSEALAPLPPTPPETGPQHHSPHGHHGEAEARCGLLLR